MNKNEFENVPESSLNFRTALKEIYEVSVIESHLLDVETVTYSEEIILMKSIQIQGAHLSL